MSMEPLIVTVPPARIWELRGLRAVPAHQGYRIGRGPHLFRAAAGPVPQGGLMALDLSLIHISLCYNAPVDPKERPPAGLADSEEGAGEN